MKKMKMMMMLLKMNAEDAMIDNDLDKNMMITMLMMYE